MIPPLLPIFLWPVLTYVLFKNYRPALALCLSLIGGGLFLPAVVSFDLPLLPAINKHTMPSIAAAMCAFFLWRGNQTYRSTGASLPGLLPKSTLARLLIAGMFLGALMTVLNNRDVLVYGPTVVPQLRIYDVFSTILLVLMTILPLLLARKYLARPEDHKTFLVVLVGAALLYSFLALYEVRMSPQINVMIYGFFAHDWFQHVRGGGFRPLVFLDHGLWLGIFLSMAIVATAVCLRVFQAKRTAYAALIAWLLIVLVLSKSLGALMIAVVLVPVVLFLGVRWQMLFAAGLSFMVVFYPMLRGAGLVPVDRLVTFAEGISAQRAHSLQYRLRNEDILLEKANQRPAWGWGSWGRNRVYDDRGRDISVTDGQWVITMGSSGWVGYISRFGLLTLPIFMLAFRRQQYDTTLATSGLCLVLGANMIDLLPNASMQPLTWMMAGAVIGRLELKATVSEDETPVAAGPAGRRRLGYSRRSAPPAHRATPQAAGVVKYSRDLSTGRSTYDS